MSSQFHSDQEVLLVTGGAGFIGSNFVLAHLACTQDVVVSVDALTYAGNLRNLESVLSHPRHHFEHRDIAIPGALTEIFERYRPTAVLHFAAESHVDRSITGPGEFIRTNIEGTYHLLEVARQYFSGLSADVAKKFRFVHVSTDEVYGSLGDHDAPFTETHPYQPNSPYSASKAASDHLARAWYHTYGLPVMITHCSNNYGPFHFPEKLIPRVIMNALAGQTLPIYGDGLNVRDWLFVGDHCRALELVLAKGVPGEVYNIGGHQEKTNLEVVQTICDHLDRLVPLQNLGLKHPIRGSVLQSYRELMTFVPDRLGHDRRYAIDPRKTQEELGFVPTETFDSGLLKTIQWYLMHPGWISEIQDGAYRNFGR